MNAIKMSAWMAVHPYKVPRSADHAYLKIANKLYDSWKFALLKNDFDNEMREIVSIVIAAYFEDVVSYTDLFGAFVRKHKELYGKYLPFYDTSEDAYFEDEINPQDVLFLIWSTLQKDAEGTFLNPENPGIVQLAEIMYKILDDEFEKVPVNDYLLDYIQDEKHYEDFFAFIRMASWLYYNSYLLGFENSYLLEKQLEGVANDTSISISQLEYAIRSELLFGEKTGPLALPLKTWYVTMLEGMAMEKEIAIINAIENHKSDYFRLDHVGETHIYVVDTEQKHHAILRSSFQNLSDGDLQSKVLITSLVKYNGEWHINGLSVWTDEEHVYWDSVEKKKTQEYTRKEVYEKVLEVNNGSPIAYFRNSIEVHTWIGDLLDVDGELTNDVLKKKENIVVFASPDKDICIIPNVGYYIKDPKNPFYDSKKAETLGIVLLVDHYSCPSAMYHYLRENKMLPDMRINSSFGEKRGFELVQDNYDFISRFFKWNFY